MSKIECSVLIVNWNVKELVIKTIASVLKQTNVTTEIIVVDNNSSDGSAVALQETFGNKIKLIASKRNLGFAKANNTASRQAHGDYLLILNPDCFLQENSLKIALTAIKENKAGILGFRLFNSDKSQQLSIRNFPKIKDVFLFCLRINHWPKLFSKFSGYFQLNFDYAKSQNVEQVMGACFLIKNELFKKLEGFDKNFFIWFEEVDLCKRVYDLGYKIFYCAKARATHVGGQSFGQVMGCKKSKIFYNSLNYYTKKHFNKFWQILFYPSCNLAIIPGCLSALWKK